MIAWDKVCMPKVKGGLGLRKTTAVNQAFQCKLACKILTKEESIWVRVMHAKYLKQFEFLACLPKPTDSPIWRSILKSRQLIRYIGFGLESGYWR